MDKAVAAPPAAPARPALPVEDVLELIQSQARMAALLEIADLVAVLNAIEHQHALQPIMDPTAYRAQMGNLQDAETLVDAYLAFRRGIEPLVAKARQQQTASKEG